MPDETCEVVRARVESCAVVVGVRVNMPGKVRTESEEGTGEVVEDMDSAGENEEPLAVTTSSSPRSPQTQQRKFLSHHHGNGSCL